MKWTSGDLNPNHNEDMTRKFPFFSVFDFILLDYELVLDPRLLNFPRYPNGYESRKISSKPIPKEKGTPATVYTNRLTVEKIRRRKKPLSHMPICQSSQAYKR